MEQYITLPTSDGFEIKGILNSKEKSENLIIFVHGFTGSMNEAHYYCGKEYFLKEGYDVFRFNLYADGEKTRKLRDCSVAIHAQDIQRVCEYFSEYENVYLIGHSLAGPCLAGVLQYPKNVTKIVFWDGAFEMKTTGNRCMREGNKIIYPGSGKHIEISEIMQKEFLEDTFLQALEKNKFPKNSIFAVYADGDRHVKNKPKTDALGIASVVIEGSNHGFTQEGKYEELFEHTLKFIES